MDKDFGRSPSGPGCQPSASAPPLRSGSSQSGIPNAVRYVAYPRIVEDVARACCNDADARLIARQEGAPDFDDSDDVTQEFWRRIASAALTALDGNRAPIWRNGIGTTVEAIDTFRARYRKQNRLSVTVRAYDAKLDALLQRVSELSREPWNIRTYRDADDCCKNVQLSVKEMIATEAASGIEAATADETRSGSTEGESPVGEAETPND